VPQLSCWMDEHLGGERYIATHYCMVANDMTHLVAHKGRSFGL
jgi:hypothetical protein